MFHQQLPCESKAGDKNGTFKDTDRLLPAGLKWWEGKWSTYRKNSNMP
jgi:hypothetical protein